jgi:O-antigen ligase
MQPGASFDDSSRLTIWSFYWGEFTASPLVGRGPETHNLAGQDHLSFYRRTTHNAYLSILVDFGVIGFCLFLPAVMFWRRDLARRLEANDRAFLEALTPAVMAFAMTETVLTAPQGLPVFIYLAAMQRVRVAAGSTSDATRRGRGHPGVRAPGRSSSSPARVR